MSRPSRRFTASLLLAAVAAACGAPETREGAAGSLWIVNARVHGHPDATAIRLEGDRIAAIGGAPFEGARAIDGKGGLVLPGFQDAHVHLLAAGLEEDGVSLAGAETLDAALAAVASFAAAHPERPWIEGGGWAYSIVPRGTFPTRHELDRAVPDRPAVLASFDGHTAWANSRALEKAGVTASTKDPSGGRIVREADGSPSGILLENAADLVHEAAPAPDRATERAALKRAALELVAHGITAIDDIETDESTLELFADLERAGELPLRVRVGLPFAGDLARYSELRREHASPRLRLGFVKGFVDGVIESRTAYLLEPYAGSDERGTPIHSRERLFALVARAHAAGFPVALHAVGDAAVRMSLDAFEAAIAKHPEIHLRHRIEHIEVISPADLPRFAKLGVTASMQPFHALPEPPTEVWSTNLGPARLRRSFAWRDLLDAKAALIFGSDWPVASPDPLLGLAVATTRRDAEGKPEGGWNAHEAISIEEAIHAYTVEPALAGDRPETGRLEVGALADLAILSSDVDLARPATLWKGRVEKTLVGGAVAFEAR